MISLGTLILNLTKDTYEQLGLPGNPAKFGPYRQRFVVQINLLEKSMIPGKKGFERIKWCFDNTLSDPFPFLISYVDSGINFNNINARNTFPPTFNARKFTIEMNFEKLNDIIFPVKEVTSQDDHWRSDIVEIYDWFGMASLRTQM
ncbi:ribonuclease P [Gigaspora rosea]|uniref:Ribonuclease P n=1 Tax=Gigaspora rosea TaxID=44941 RepID=A0A397V3B1_9GLOM|nr:ribonuclease P [Gigaspora rosea]